MKSQTTSGFTLVEIMIVVMIIGLLATLALPGFRKVRENSQNARLANDLRVYGNAADIFATENGVYPEDSSSGDIPTDFELYIKVNRWQAGPSIGGVFDMERDSFGVRSAVGVHGFDASLAQLQAFDDQFDDGDLSNGVFRRIAGDRYYYIVAE